MALDATTLGTEIKDALVNAGYVDTSIDGAEVECEDIWRTIAGALISHIQTNAEVSVSAGQAIDLDPTDGTRDGETMEAGTGTVS